MPDFSTYRYACAVAGSQICVDQMCVGHDMYSLCQTNSVIQHPESKDLVSPQTIVVLAVHAQLSSVSRPGQMYHK